MSKSISSHRPPHIYFDNTWYILTASTIEHTVILNTDSHLRIWVEVLEQLTKEFNLNLRAWVVLRNHYHLLLKSQTGRDIGKFIGRLNGRTSHEFNLLDDAVGRQVWYNYWDTCIRTVKDYWTRFNYIHNNPVKHGYVEQHAEWQFSSYHYYLSAKGAEWLEDCWRQYPVIDYLEGDDF